MVKYDWLWKTLLYGQFLDLNFLLRLSNYESINKYILKKKYIVGQGIQFGADQNPIGKLGKLKLLSSYFVKPFKISYNLNDFKRSFVHRIRNEELFYGERL